MKTVHADASTKANGSFEPFEYEIGDTGTDEVDIAVESCGISHGAPNRPDFILK